MSSDERVVSFRPRTIVTAAALLVAVGVVLWVVWVSRRVLVWTFVSAFLAVALSPAVDAIQRRGLRRRDPAPGRGPARRGGGGRLPGLDRDQRGARSAVHPDARQADQRPRRRRAG